MSDAVNTQINEQVTDEFGRQFPYPQVDHPWSGTDDGHNCVLCGPDGEYKCDKLAHFTKDLEADMREYARKRGRENLRRYGGIAGPGIIHVR